MILRGKEWSDSVRPPMEPSLNISATCTVNLPVHLSLLQCFVLYIIALFVELQLECVQRNRLHMYSYTYNVLIIYKLGVC